jgi:hypothetical protein
LKRLKVVVHKYIIFDEDPADDVDDSIGRVYGDILERTFVESLSLRSCAICRICSAAIGPGLGGNR